MKHWPHHLGVVEKRCVGGEGTSLSYCKNIVAMSFLLLDTIFPLSRGCLEGELDVEKEY
jgi:hypothetical protein